MAKKIKLLSWTGSGKARPLMFDEVPAVLSDRFSRVKRRWWEKNIRNSRSGIAVNSNDRILFVLINSVYFETNYGTIVVPAGFIWDGASVPNALQSVEPAFDDETYFAALLHDWLYATEMLPRYMADDLLAQAVAKGGGSWFRCKYMWASVRVGAGSVWSVEHTEDSIWWARDLMEGDEWLKRKNPWKTYTAFIEIMLLSRPRIM